MCCGGQLLGLSRPADRRGWSRAYGAMCAWGPGIIAGIETLPHLLDLGTQLFLSLLGPSSTSSSTSPPPPSSLPASFISSLASPHGYQIRQTLLALHRPPLLELELRLSSHTSARPPSRRRPVATEQAKHGFGLAVRAPVLRALHLLQHRARGKLLEKSDPCENIYGEDHDTAKEMVARYAISFALLTSSTSFLLVPIFFLLFCSVYILCFL